MTSGEQALLLLAGSSLAGLVGLAQWLAGTRQKRTLVQRTALDVAEARAAKPTNRLETRLRRTRLGRGLAAQLAAGGLQWRVVDLLAAFLAGSAAMYTIAQALLPGVLAALVTGGALRGGWLWVQRRQQARIEQFVGQLPDLARVLSNSAAAGLSVPSALELAQAELDDPAAAELDVIVQGLRLGQPVDAALQELDRRVPSREVRVLVNTLVIQQRSGGDVVHGLREMAATLEARKDLRREIRTTMAGAVSTGYVVTGMGVGALLLINLVIPGALEQMLASGAGRIAMLVSAGLFASGFLLIRRITRIDP